MLTQDKFDKLADRWKEDTKYLSDPRRYEHLDYQRILEFGFEAVPFLLRDLEKDMSHWFHALWFITGQNPVPHEDCGYIIKMAKAWLEWGRKEGIL